jgi:hypothetical protein
MPWDIKRAGDGGVDWLIMDGNRLRGSIHHAEPVFRVEIPWSGRGGDITFSGPTLGHACTFVRGVEAVFNRVTRPRS